MNTRFILVGGFLGAGKTTAIARLARRYRDQGLKVGIVTNDQAADLVDTQSLRAQGYLVGEVAGACFCCNFNQLLDTVGSLEQAARPDVILAEPVGSCTDLAATVIQPLVQLYGGRFSVAPYAVILKPSHGRKILRRETSLGFSSKAAYIFSKQLAEADLLVINRSDELPAEELAELTHLLQREQPDVPILPISAKTGAGFDALQVQLDRPGQYGRRILDLDYEIYAAGEAELGWLNSRLSITANQELALDALLLDIVGRLRARLADLAAETAHLKVIGLADGFYGVANLVSSDNLPELSLPSHGTTRTAELVVNARVAIDPELLEREVRQTVAAACAAAGARTEWHETRSFRPGRPVPTHRLQAAAQ